ncbi:MAG: hypothetical protein GXY84_04690 [Clostridiales bacterium]|nr:hypothetical protein [Clostridiales bacterium]
MRKVAALLLMLLALPVVSAFAGEAADLTGQVDIKAGSRAFALERLLDRDYTTAWRGEGSGRVITVTSRQAMHGLYICFLEEPRAWTAEYRVDGAWQALPRQTSRYQHQYLALPGVFELRLKPTGNNRAWFQISELYVFGAGATPGFVQRWREPAEENALLVLFAHPDDEALFFGGAIPVYAGQRGLNVVAVCLSAPSTVRRAELLNSLWEMGMDAYPVFGPFQDKHSLKLATAYKNAGETRVKRFVAGLFEQYRPMVVLTHDLEGEYGHGQHKMCADSALHAFDQAARRADAFQVRKLYLHLYPENQVEMDWDQPLPRFGGRSGFEVAQAAYRWHQTQQHLGQFQVEPRGSRHSSYRFGLARSLVGPDIKGNDLMEHIDLDEYTVNTLD